MWISLAQSSLAQNYISLGCSLWNMNFLVLTNLNNQSQSSKRRLKEHEQVSLNEKYELFKQIFDISLSFP